MRKSIFILSSVFLFFSCKSTTSKTINTSSKPDFTIAFGSCNINTIDNLLWDDILNSNPDVWIWGGDIIYADTDDMQKLGRMYDAQNAVAGYKNLKQNTPIIGSWDDHDYGLNDGGIEFKAKKESQQMFLDFMGIQKNSPRRNQEGIYTSHDYDLPEGQVKVIVLDTRYFRTALTPDTQTKKRTKPNTYGEGDMLGETQWQWLQKELSSSKADFNVIISSIQFLSNEHGFECWGNFPHEVDKLNTMIAASKAKGVMMLSGDRHISEFSKAEVKGLPYPLIDFTSSGLTHAYSAFTEESNPFRVGKVVSVESFGVLQFDFKQRQVSFQMIGDNGEVLGELKQGY